MCVIRWIVSDWNNCNVTCGVGVRIRSVECKIFLEFSRTIATLPDKECSGIKPPSSQHCYQPLCSQTLRGTPRRFRGKGGGRKKRKRKEGEEEKKRRKEGEEEENDGDEDEDNGDADDKNSKRGEDAADKSGRREEEEEGDEEDDFSNEISSSNSRKNKFLAQPSTGSRKSEEPRYEWKETGWTSCSSPCLGGKLDTGTHILIYILIYLKRFCLRVSLSQSFLFCTISGIDPLFWHQKRYKKMMQKKQNLIPISAARLNY